MEELNFVGLTIIVAAISAVVSFVTSWRIAKHQIVEDNKSLHQELVLYQTLAKRETLIRIMEMLVTAYTDFTTHTEGSVMSVNLRDGTIVRFNALISAVELDNPSRNKEIKKQTVSASNYRDFNDKFQKAVELITKELKDLAEKL